jgi:hypothetical protein
MLGLFGCRPPEPNDPVTEPITQPPLNDRVVEQPEPPPTPAPQPPAEVRFVLWRGEGIDLRLSHVDVARQHEAVVACLTPAPADRRALMLHIEPEVGILVGFMTGPADDALVACVRLAMRDVKLLDSNGEPLTTAGHWLELTMVINPIDDGLSSASTTDQVVRVEDNGACIERYESPCEPNKACMGPLDAVVRCPTNRGLAVPTNAPASTIMLVWNDRPTPDKPRRIVAQRWNELCLLDLREPPTPDAEYEITRAGPIPCSLLDALLADAKRVDRALQKHRVAVSNLYPNVSVHVQRLEPKWDAVRVVNEWSGPSERLPDPSAQMLTTLEHALERWTTSVH